MSASRRRTCLAALCGAVLAGLSTPGPVAARDGAAIGAPVRQAQVVEITAEREFKVEYELPQGLLPSGVVTGTLDGVPGTERDISMFMRFPDNAVIELPGIDKDDLQIQAKENTIRIAGRKTVNYPDASVHRRERTFGAFDRTLSVPVQLDPDGIKAEYRDGVLELFLPRAQRDKPRNIQIS